MVVVAAQIKRLTGTKEDGGSILTLKTVPTDQSIVTEES